MASKCIAPDNPDQLKKETIERISPKSPMEGNEQFKDLLKNIGEMWTRAETKSEKLHILAIVTPILPYKTIEVRINIGLNGTSSL